MSTYEKLGTWMDTYRDTAFDILRVYLGIALLFRGMLFILYPAHYLALLDSAPGWLASSGVYYFTALVHLIGGGMIAVGFLTRMATLVQIPVLIGAVFLVHLPDGIVSQSQSFEFSSLVLFLLVLVFLHGSGRLSVDARWHHDLSPFRKLDRQFGATGDVAFDLLRIYLGIGLFVRGVLFIGNSEAVMDLLGGTSENLLRSITVMHYVALAHLAGGAAMALGLMTRIAALVQIPILLGAVFLVHFQGGLLAPSQSLEFSVLVLVLLVMIFLYGSGRLSLDHFLIHEQEASEAELLVQQRSRERLRAQEVMAVQGGEESDSDVLIAEEPGRLVCPLTGTCPVVSATVPREHPWVIPTRKYSPVAAVHFLTGITGRPKEVVFHCDKCGKRIDSTRNPRDLNYYKYH